MPSESHPGAVAPTLSPGGLTAALRAEATALGFSLFGVCPAVPPIGAARLDEWLSRGYAGEMAYIPARREAYGDPNRVLEGVRSIVMLGLSYRTKEPRPPQAGQGRISRYAWGEADYHDIIHSKLRRLIAALHERVPDAKARGIVDTAPLLEREFAQIAGLGWIGKHTLLINKPAGSYFFLAALLTDRELSYDAPFTADHCGTCTACLDACPTHAFPEPGVLDATRCISYLTIELRGPVPRELRPGIGEWLFGCDVCQDVCPWNRHAVERHQGQLLENGLEPTAQSNPVDLIGLFGLDGEAFRRRFRRTPLWRARRRGILRNAAIVLGNQRATSAVPALVQGLADVEPLVRGACAWALAQIDPVNTRAVLLSQLAVESDESVRHEITEALKFSGPSPATSNGS